MRSPFWNPSIKSNLYLLTCMQSNLRHMLSASALPSYRTLLYPQLINSFTFMCYVLVFYDVIFQHGVMHRCDTQSVISWFHRSRPTALQPTRPVLPIQPPGVVDRKHPQDTQIGSSKHSEMLFTSSSSSPSDDRSVFVPSSNNPCISATRMALSWSRFHSLMLRATPTIDLRAADTASLASLSSTQWLNRL